MLASPPSHLPSPITLKGGEVIWGWICRSYHLLFAGLGSPPLPVKPIPPVKPPPPVKTRGWRTAHAQDERKRTNSWRVYTKTNEHEFARFCPFFAHFWAKNGQKRANENEPWQNRAKPKVSPNFDSGSPRPDLDAKNQKGPKIKEINFKSDKPEPSEPRKYFFLFVKTYFSVLRPILHKPGLTRVLSDSKITSFATDSELFRKVICTACVWLPNVDFKWYVKGIVSDNRS